MILMPAWPPASRSDIVRLAGSPARLLLAVEERAHACRRLGRRLDHRGDQRFGVEALIRVLLDDARQRVDDRVIRHRRIRGGDDGEFERLVDGPAGRHQVLGDAARDAFLGTQRTAREHHVGHQRRAGQARKTHRGAKPHVQAARGLGQGEEGGLVHHPDVAGRRHFEARTDCRARDRRDHRYAAILDLLEHVLPFTEKLETVDHRLPAHLAQIETRAKMLVRAVEHGGPNIVGHASKYIAQSVQHGPWHGIALFRPIEADKQYVIALGYFQKWSFHRSGVSNFGAAILACEARNSIAKTGSLMSILGHFKGARQII
ncbi:hypothetical protein BGLA2_270014 [Burkholderia gladioli]|nr:hypothetical protein BGLA2_270014 [Burkholderia gladioli]